MGKVKVFQIRTLGDRAGADFFKLDRDTVFSQDGLHPHIAVETFFLRPNQAAHGFHLGGFDAHVISGLALAVGNPAAIADTADKQQSKDWPDETVHGAGRLVKNKKNASYLAVQKKDLLLKTRKLPLSLALMKVEC